jgi:hypothetical protein
LFVLSASSTPVTHSLYIGVLTSQRVLILGGHDLQVVNRASFGAGDKGKRYVLVFLA